MSFFSLPEGDPSNYMTYFRRATVYLAMGKSKSAIPDLDKVIELKPDFVAVSTHLNHTGTKLIRIRNELNTCLKHNIF